MFNSSPPVQEIFSHLGSLNDLASSPDLQDTQWLKGLSAKTCFNECNTNELRVFLKRDDLIDPVVSGNKWRKLKYNCEKALNTSHQTILTFGGAFSNHIVATARAGKLVGLKTIGIIRGEENKPLNETLQTAQENGMELHFISRADYRQKEDPNFIQALRNQFGSFWLIPEGGANYHGFNGCLEITSEIDKEFDIIAISAGTGTTAAGIIASLSDHQRLWVFPALKNGGFIKDNIAKHLNQLYFDTEAVAHDLSKLIIFDEYHFGGYAKVPAVLVHFIQQFYKRTLIKLDPIYTSKMMLGLLDQIVFNKEAHNKSIVAVHTGGIQGAAGIEKKLNTSLYPL